MKYNTKHYYSPKQGRLPLFIADNLDICDLVLVFDQIMEEIGIEQYLKPEPSYRYGRSGYPRVNMFKTILFGFMDTGYTSLRELEDRCRVHITEKLKEYVKKIRICGSDRNSYSKTDHDATFMRMKKAA